MALQEMFPAIANSPATELSAAITDIQTTITLLDASKLPDAPNIATIGVDETAETVRYEGKSGNDLTGVTRGFSGTAAKAWAVGVGVARYFTAYDADALRENVAEHSTQLAETEQDLVERSYNARKYEIKGNANYLNPADWNWYEDSAYTMPANDDTAGLQMALNQLNGQRYNHPNTGTAKPGGGVLRIPKGRYLFTDTLLISNASEIIGDGWGTVLIFKPSSPKDAFAPNPHNSNTGESTVSWQDIKVRNLMVTASWEGNYSNSYPIYNSYARNGFDFRDCRLTKLENVSVMGFMYGNAVYYGNKSQANFTWSYFNQVLQCNLRNNKCSVYIGQGGNSTQLIGGEYSNDYNFPDDVKNYEIEVYGAACLISGVTIEGTPKIAHIYDDGQGTNITGSYNETTQGAVPFVDHRKKSNYGSSSSKGNFVASSNLHYLIEHSAKQEGGYNLSLGYDIQRGMPQEIEMPLQNVSFNQGPSGGFWVSQVGNNSIVSNPGFISRKGIKMTSSGTQLNRLYSNTFQMPSGLIGSDLYVTLLARISDGNVRDMYLTGAGHTNNKYFVPYVKFDNGYVLYVAKLPTIATNGIQIWIDQRVGSIVGATIEICNVRFFYGGFDIYPKTNRLVKEYGISAPTSGDWIVGDYIENLSSFLGHPNGWICTSAGSPGTWRVTGQKGMLTSISDIPMFQGQIAVISGSAYIAVGTSSPSDWKQINN